MNKKHARKANNTTKTAYQRGTKARADLVYQGVVMVTPTQLNYINKNKIKTKPAMKLIFFNVGEKDVREGKATNSIISIVCTLHKHLLKKNCYCMYLKNVEANKRYYYLFVFYNPQEKRLLLLLVSAQTRVTHLFGLLIKAILVCFRNNML